MGLKLNKEKCVFKKSKLSFFGIEISEKGINPDPNKVVNLKNALPPCNTSELRSFLGLCTYVSRFIQNFSDKTAVLRDLLKGNTKFVWTAEHEKSFNCLKNELTSDSLLGFYDPQKEVELVTDASGFAIGGVLLQKDQAGTSRPICYVSRSLNVSELKYGITEKEALALVWCVEKLHLYLYGKKFNVMVDHQPLKFIFSPKAKLNPRIARWQIRLQAYNFTVLYKQGSENIADFISRMRMKESLEIESENKNSRDLTQEYLNFITEKSTPDILSIEDIRNASKTDKNLVAVSQAILTNRWFDNPLVNSYKKIKNELSDNNGVILRGDKIIIPFVLRNKVLKLAHEGHLGVNKCKSLLREKVYWPSMGSDIEKHVSDCIPCLANSKDTRPEPLKPSVLPEQPWSEIAIDFYGPLPTGEKLLVITDLYSRFPFIEFMKNTDANNVIIRLEQLFTTYGYASRVRSDNGPPYNSSTLKSYFENHNIEHIKITPLHPKANGCVEKFMQVINKSIKTAVYEQQNWRKALNITLLNYRTAAHATTEKSPALLFFGREINNKLPNIKTSTSQYDKEVRKRQASKFEKSKSRVDKARKAVVSDVKVGDIVILKRLKKGNKFDSKFYQRQFKVIEKNKSLVVIEDGKGNRLARNTSFVKKISPIVVASPNYKKPGHEGGQKKVYPKRIRKQRFVS